MNALTGSIRQIRRSISKRGAIGTIGLVMSNSIDGIKNFSPARRRAIKFEKRIAEEFDVKYGVNTAANVPLGKLHIDSANAIYGVRYEPIDRVDFSGILSGLNLQIDQTTFVDFGSGKGRAILLASALSFRKIIGVEFSQELNSIAADNIARYGGERKCADIELICMDAARYVVPEAEPLVLYFFNPFERPVMAQVADNVVASFEAHPRRIVVLYFTPKYADVWDGIPFLKKKTAKTGLCVYDSNL